MRVVFAGTPDAAVPSLDALLASGHEIVGVVTRPDAPRGRARTVTASPVAARAEAAGLTVLRADRLDEATTDRIASLRPDLGVVVAYGALVRERLLAVPRHGWVNLHFSLLPRWRGAAPVQHALIAGDVRTGACVFRLVGQLDAGDVLSSLTRPIGAEETAGDLLRALAEEGATLLEQTVEAIGRGSAHAVPQHGEATLAPKLTAQDGRLDWSARAAAVHGRFRGVTPEPGAWTTVHGARLKVLDLRRARGAAAPLPPGRIGAAGRRTLVGTGTEPLELVAVQPAGKRAMPAGDWLRGVSGEVALQ